MKSDIINQKMDEVKFCNGFNTAIKLFKYKNSRTVKSIQERAQMLQEKDSWAYGLIKGFEHAKEKGLDKSQRKNELDILFKNKEKQKEQDKDIPLDR